MKRDFALYPLLCQIVLMNGLLLSSALQAANLPSDPRENITYWRPYIVKADADKEVARAHQVFQRLLRTWTGPSARPELQVIDSAQGVWAASLADGNILLTRAALETSLRLGKQWGDDLLAFVLAHEIAHQRANDLWHQRFFRLVGSAAEEGQQPVMPDFSLAERERIEDQADHDGLLAMAVSGFDPRSLLQGEGFFQQWLTSIWGRPCNGEAACIKAGQRLRRTQSQIEQARAYHVVYQLALQHLVAGRLDQAQHYFSLFARAYPSQEAFMSQGMVALLRAFQLREAQAGEAGYQPRYFPLVLEYPERIMGEGISARRGGFERGEYQRVLQQAQSAYQQVLQLQPGHPPAVLMLSLVYLLKGELNLAYGILADQYTRQDLAGRLLAALIEQARHPQGEALQTLVATLDKAPADEGVLVYAAYYNWLYRLPVAERAGHWQRLSQWASRNGAIDLFALATRQINPGLRPRASAQALAGYGPDLVVGGRHGVSNKDDTLWIEGEPFIFSRDQGIELVTDKNGHLAGAWHGVDTLKVGNSRQDLLATLGHPDRIVTFLNGSYFAYDRAGLAVHVTGNVVNDWLKY